MRSITGLSMGVGGRSLLLDVAGAVQANAKPGKKKSIIISNISHLPGRARRPDELHRRPRSRVAPRVGKDCLPLVEPVLGLVRSRVWTSSTSGLDELGQACCRHARPTKP